MLSLVEFVLCFFYCIGHHRVLPVPTPSFPTRRSSDRGQLAHLRRLRLDQLLAAITDMDAPQARHTVEDAVTVAVVDIATLGVGDNAAAAEGLEDRKSTRLTSSH